MSSLSFRGYKPAFAICRECFWCRQRYWFVYMARRWKFGAYEWLCEACFNLLGYGND